MRILRATVLLALACWAQDSQVAASLARAKAAATGRAVDTPRVRNMVAEIVRLARETHDPGEAVALGILGEQLTGAGDYREARDTLERALTLANSRFGPDSREAADISLNLSSTLVPLGDLSRARTLAEHAAAVFEKLYGAQDRQVAMALTLVGSTIVAQGEYASAVATLSRALAIEEKAGAPVGETLSKLAFAQWSNGDFAQARLNAERAVALLDTGSNPGRAAGEAQRVMGDILVEMGDYSRARDAQDRALHIFETWFGADSVQVGDDLVGMGNSARDAGDLERAKAVTERAVKVYEARLGPENTRVGGALDNLGQVLVLMKQWSAAQDCFRRALAIQTKALGPESPWTADVYQGLAKVAAGTGNYAEAEKLLRRNIESWREQLGPSHPFTAVSLDLLARVMAHRGEHAAALKTALESAELRREEIAYTVRTVDERQALRFAARKSGALDIALTLAADGSAEDAAGVWDAVIRSRALVLDEMAARNRAARAAKDPATRRLIAEETRARGELARLAVQGKGNMTAAAFRQALDARRDAVYRADEALAAASDVYRGSTVRERAGYREVAQSIPQGAAIVAYVRYQRRDFSTPADLSAPTYLAFVLHAGAPEVRVARLGPASRIDALVAALNREIARERDAAGHSERRNEAAYRAAGDALRGAVWDPVAKLLAGASSVYLVPDGSLQLFNFAALPVGTNRYLAESGPLLHLLSTERDLVRADAPPRGSGLLAIGNPSYTATEAPALNCGNSSPLHFEPLPGSAAEVETLGAILKTKGWHEEMLLGDRATKDAVKRDSAGKRVVHLATHGFSLDASCPNPAPLRENPLLRSGLALSGSVLTAEEVAALDLTAAEWVVLSACNTGIGDLSAGEGVLGLRRAFQEAGAGAVISSLWQVDDRSAVDWMTILYRSHFLDRRETAEAVQIADRKVLAARRSKNQSTHPFYWGAFVAIER